MKDDDMNFEEDFNSVNFVEKDNKFEKGIQLQEVKKRLVSESLDFFS